MQEETSADCTAAAEGHTDVVQLLLANGADVNAEDKYDRTPLLNATTLGHKDVVELLIVRGADVEAKDVWGQTPLGEAARRGHMEIFELLNRHAAKE